MIEVCCEVCETPFLARKERVEQGMGKYCSRECSHEGRRREEKKKWGRKDLARCYNIGGRYCARWYGENGEVLSTSYGRWWWEMNVGEVPDGAVILFKDNNPMNINPSNFVLGTMKEATDKGKNTIRKDKSKFSSYIDAIRKSNMGHLVKKETREKISKANKGRVVTNEQRVQTGNRTAKLWKDGFFDGIHKGKNSIMWRGGTEQKYPKEFDDSLREFVKSRDHYKCQICSKDLYRTRHAHVHHRNGNKHDNDTNNLILLCSKCHGKVHAKSKESPPIMALREELY